MVTYEVPNLSKFLGSCLIDNNCTCTIKVVKHADGTVSTISCLTHYGHECELQHVWITQKYQREIAAKLQQRLPRENILDTIRNSVGDQTLREHLINDQDIKNIKKSYGIDTVQRHQNDQDSVLSWIEEWSEDEYSPGLFFKLQGQPDSENRLEKDDFMLIIQTEAQKHLMRQFGGKGIYCDTTHGTTGYDFKRTSLLVSDELDEGIPVAHFISNKETFHFMGIFFKEVKNNCGFIAPRWFMSDTASQFYDAFALVNEVSPIQLICTWHVEKAWREELRQKVSSIEIQSEVYRYLGTVVEQTDRNVFEDYLSEFLIRLQMSSSTTSFSEYFKKEWLPKKAQWGYCYRVSLGINTNMFCEAFHRVFKYKYLKGKINRRVDKCLVNLLKFSRDKMFERITKLIKGKNRAKLKRVHRSHLESMNVPFTKVLKQQNEGTWIIESAVGKREYFAEKSQDHPCTEKCSCRLSCLDCNVCPRMFRFQCADYLIKGNIYKHIHLLSRYMLQSEENNEGQHREESAEIRLNLTKYDCENKLEVQDESNDSKNELVALRKFVANEANEDTFAMLKKRTQKAVLELLSEV